MGKGSYIGGSTVLGPWSDWYSKSDLKQEKLLAQGHREGEIAREKIANKQAAKSAAMERKNAKELKNLKRHRLRVEEKKAKLLAKDGANALPEPGSKAEKYQKLQAEKMARVEIVRKKKRKRPTS